MPETLLSLFPKLQDLLALSAEDIGGVIIEVMPPAMQNGMLNIAGLTGPLYPLHGPSYPNGTQREVERVLAEGLTWLVTHGLMITDPSQPTPSWYVPTRQAHNLKTRTDVEAFRKGRILPDDLLPVVLAEKVAPLFRRGDPDVAVFQAFKEVEVAVRKAANANGAGYADSEVGTALMRKAFHPDTGPLTDKTVVLAEREAEMHLFAGAIGHAKNPPGHRDFPITPREAAQLIIFASYLLGIVERRAK